MIPPPPPPPPPPIPTHLTGHYYHWPLFALLGPVHGMINVYTQFLSFHFHLALICLK